MLWVLAAIVRRCEFHASSGVDAFHDAVPPDDAMKGMRC
jgi:hypothetical protein